MFLASQAVILCTVTACYRDGNELYGNKCDVKKHNGKKLTVLAGN